MVEILKELVNFGTFNVLQDNLEDWLENFKFNTCDQNVAKCCEIIETNAKLQGQLFKLLGVCASEGGKNNGASVIKSRLLPVLSQGFYYSDTDSKSSLLGSKTNSYIKDDFKDTKNKHGMTNDDIQRDITDSKKENEVLRLKLQETKAELDRQGRQSSSEKMFNKEEIETLREQLDFIKEENMKLKSKARLTETYQHEVEHLKEDVALLSTHRSFHGHHTPRCHTACDSYFHSGCPIDSCYIKSTQLDPFCIAKEQLLVSKYNDLFSVGRNDAMNILSGISDEYDNNQKIIYHSVLESFNAAKSVFRQYKSKIRNELIGHHGSCSLEEAVQSYINIHADNDIDMPVIFREVIANLDFKVPLISRPPGRSFDIIGSFIRDLCRVAWSMTSQPMPLDVYYSSSEGELFDESRYRRSYDSDFSAAFVLHHIWPCLVKNGSIIAKGEAITKRAGSIKAKSGRSAGLSSSVSLSRMSDISSSATLVSPSTKSIRSRSPLFKGRY